MTDATPMTTMIKTRILIISDTHGVKPRPQSADAPTTENESSEFDIRLGRPAYRDPLPEADVVLHCGDLTKRTRVQEYEKTFSMLRAIRAPLKLAIAGNHDITLDKPFWLNQWGGSREEYEKVQNIIRVAAGSGVRYLEEGVHEFCLRNGARLKVYASPYTPAYGGWAFQYKDGHNFDIPSGVDVAMTHGPPRNVLDEARLGNIPAGCSDLFKAVYGAKPRIHCFGHIHEGWGMYLARWKEANNEVPQLRTVVDTENSTMLLAKDFKPDPPIVDGSLVGEEDWPARLQWMRDMTKRGGVLVDLTEGPHKLEEGQQTLFLNAAIMDVRYQPNQLPWLVDIDLPPAF